MKKFLISILIFGLTIIAVTACGRGGDNKPDDNPVNNPGESGEKNNGNHDESTSGKKVIKGVKPSELISLEEAGELLEVNMRLVEGYLDKAEADGFLISEYTATGDQWETFQIAIKQDAGTFLKNTKETFSLSSSASPVDKIGDWAYLTGSSDGMSKSLHIAYGDCYLEISLIGDTDNDGRSLSEDATWKIEKLTKAAKLAIERLVPVTE